MKQKITDYLDEIYGGTFTATHLQKLVTRLESAKRLITQRRKKHWDESDVVLITYADQFHSNDLKPLPTFNQFYHQWLQSIFLGIFDPLIGLMSPVGSFYLVLAIGLALNISFIIVLKGLWLRRKAKAAQQELVHEH